MGLTAGVKFHNGPLYFSSTPSAPRNVPAEEAPSTSQDTRSFHASEDRDNVDATNTAKPASSTHIVNNVAGKPAMSPSVRYTHYRQV